MKYISAAHTCADCGGDCNVATYDQKPTPKDEQALADSLGGMNCIEVKTFVLTDGGYVLVEAEKGF